MDFEFEIKTLEEIASPGQRSIAMGPFGSNIRKENYKLDGVPIIRGLNLSAERFNDDDFVFLSEAKADELKSSNAFPEDIIFTAQGNVGQVGIIPKNAKYKRYVLSQNLMKITCDKAKVNPLFIFYFFRSNIGQHEILSRANTTGVPCISQPLTSLKSFTVPTPDLTTQNFIAKLLSDIDEKIELNRKMNQTLEQIAQAIFKHWFIDFEFPNEEGKPYKSSGGEMVDSELGEIPKGWQIGSFCDEFKIIMGQSPPGETYNEIGNGIKFFQGRTDFGFRFPIKRVFCTEPKRIAEKFDTLISVRAPIGDLNMAYEKCCIGRGLTAIRSNYKSYAYYKTFSLKPNFKIFEAEGTVFGALTKNHFLNLQIVIPSIDIVKKFEKYIWPIDYQIYNLSKQIYTLTNLRGLLLPKLISGKIRVKTDE